MSAPVRLSPSGGSALGTAAARNLVTTTKTAPQMAALTPRWLLRMLPWVQATAGTYRVNRRRGYRVDDGRVSFETVGGRVRVIPAELRELPLLRGFEDAAALAALADRFEPREFASGETIAARGDRSDQAVLIARGRAQELRPGEYTWSGAEPAASGGQADPGPSEASYLARVLGPGDHFGDRSLLDPDGRWPATVRAVSPGTLLTLPQGAFDELVDRFESLRSHLALVRETRPPPHNKHGEAAVALAAGHAGEPDLPGTYVDYEVAPREYELSVAQTRLRVHTRVADLYNDPMDQLEQQLRLTVAALREQQEHELVNNREFGLLYNADLRQRLYPSTGPPTPDDLDRLISRRRRTHFLFAHPRTIAAFGRECTRRRIYPQTVEVAGQPVLGWRGVPLLPCDKLPVSSTNTSSVLALRTGEQHQGVVGVHRTGLPDEYEPGVSVRCSGVDGKGIASYLASTYYSVAVLVPDALGILEDVEIGPSWSP